MFIVSIDYALDVKEIFLKNVKKKQWRPFGDIRATIVLHWRTFDWKDGMTKD